MLFSASPVSPQITVGKLDGWRTLAQQLKS
jgi:hypothetical protein